LIGERALSLYQQNYSVKFYENSQRKTTPLLGGPGKKISAKDFC